MIRFKVTSPAAAFSIEKNPVKMSAQSAALIKGDPGKSAYEYAKEGGYPGTEEDFRADLAKVAEFQAEEWVFTMDDGTTVVKKVVVV